MSEVTHEAVKARVRPGRTSLKGVHRATPKHVRRAYSYNAKRVILLELEEHGLDHVIAGHWPDVSTGKQRHKIVKLLWSWKKSKARIDAADTVAKRNVFKARPSRVGCVLSTETENNLGAWVRALRADGIPVSQQMIKVRVLEIARTRALQTLPQATIGWKASRIGRAFRCERAELRDRNTLRTCTRLLWHLARKSRSWP
jgi:hypothetical protein